MTKFKKELFGHFQFVMFPPCPSLKLIKYLVPLSVDFFRSVYAFAPYAISFPPAKK